jgi:hypothetical protein
MVNSNAPITVGADPDGSSDSAVRLMLPAAKIM